MPMCMVRIRHVRMRVALRLVAVPVTVFACGHGIVRVAVVPVVVPVGMLVLQRLVLVLVRV